METWETTERQIEANTEKASQLIFPEQQHQKTNIGTRLGHSLEFWPRRMGWGGEEGRVRVVGGWEGEEEAMRKRTEVVWCGVGVWCVSV